MDVITYEGLYEILRLEKYKKELQPLSQDFYKKVVKYLQEKELILKSQKQKDSVFASDSIKKTEKQVDNVKRILREFYNLRESKICQLALFYSRSGSKMKDMSLMTKEELMFFEDLVNIFNRFKTGIIDNILLNLEPSIKNKPKEIKTEERAQEHNYMLEFTQFIPKFLGEDLKIYGPFDVGDVANLPKRASEALINNKRAQKI